MAVRAVKTMTYKASRGAVNMGISLNHGTQSTGILMALSGFHGVKIISITCCGASVISRKSPCVLAVGAVVSGTSPGVHETPFELDGMTGRQAVVSQTCMLGRYFSKMNTMNLFL